MWSTEDGHNIDENGFVVSDSKYDYIASSYNNRFIWSKDSRYVAVETSARHWINTSIINTENSDIILLPERSKILEICPDIAPAPNGAFPEDAFKINKWINPTTICIDFSWQKYDYTAYVYGKYLYDISNDTIEILDIYEDY